MTITTPSLATPTSVLIYDGPPHTAEWFAARRSGITATDVPKILGMSGYGTARSVWLDKQDQLPDDDESEAAYWGTVFEEPVAQRWASLNRVEVSPIGVLANFADRWMIASLDRRPHRCTDGDGPCQLEIKTRSAFVAGKWRSDVPDDVLAQVQWQLAVTGYGHAHVAVLFGGQKLEQYRIDRDEDVITFITGEAQRVWMDVLNRTIPQEDPTAALGRLLDALHPDRDGDVTVEAVTAQALAAEYLDASSEYKAAEVRKECARAAVLDHLGAGERLVVDTSRGPVPVFEYRQRSRTTVSAGPLKDGDLWDAAIAAGAVKTSTYRQMACLGNGVIDGE